MGKNVVRILALLLLALGLAYTAKGIAMPWLQCKAIDLELRSAEFDYFAEGTYPHRRVAEAVSGDSVTKHTVYPPYAFVILSVFCWPATEQAERLIFQIISLVGLLFMAAYGAKELRFAGRSAALLGIAIPLAFSGNYIAFYQGQFSIISVALVVGQMWLLQKNRSVPAGLCWALAMIKPQVAVAFGLLFLIRRENFRGLVAGVGLLAVMTTFALWWTSTPPWIFWEQGVSRQRLRFVETTAYAAAVWVQGFGIPPRTATMSGLGILAITGLAFLAPRVRQFLDLPRAAALCSVLGLSLFYHVHYDNMMLFPLLLALVAEGLRQRSAVLFTAAAVLGFICYAEPGFLVGAAQASAFVRWFVFLSPLASCVALLLMTRSEPQPTRTAA